MLRYKSYEGYITTIEFSVHNTESGCLFSLIYLVSVPVHDSIRASYFS